MPQNLAVVVMPRGAMVVVVPVPVVVPVSVPPVYESCDHCDIHL